MMKNTIPSISSIDQRFFGVVSEDTCLDFDNWDTRSSRDTRQLTEEQQLFFEDGDGDEHERGATCNHHHNIKLRACSACVCVCCVWCGRRIYFSTVPAWGRL
mmetsp:Transcript_16908/g.27658  ORF Transcript_16908/g.27658 Transcript_16908/m.27658 type:complete len:102 (-) Transcript_16908:139-444(-)